VAVFLRAGDETLILNVQRESALNAGAPAVQESCPTLIPDLRLLIAVEPRRCVYDEAGGFERVLRMPEHILQQAASGERDLNRLKSSAFEKLGAAA
jgi:hypothetical protein